MFSSCMDIDVDSDGTVIVSTFTGYIAKMTSTFTGISYINTGTNNATFVSFVPGATGPSLSINDVSVTEGTNTQTLATFTVTLSQPNASLPMSDTSMVAD